MQPRWFSAGLLLLAVWAGILFWQSYVHFPWHINIIFNFLPLTRFGAWQPAWFMQHWLGTLKLYLLLFGFGIGALGNGLCILNFLFPAVRSRLEKTVFAFALGFSALSLTTFLLGVAGGFHTLVYAAIYTVFVGWGAWTLWKLRADLKPARGWWWGKAPQMPDRVLGWIILLVIAAEYLSANAPELFFDSLVYHLGVTSQWIQHGRILPLPTVFFSNLPMHIEMLYTGALLLADERLCRLLHVSLGVLAALAVFALGRRWFGRRVGFWAAGIFVTIPLLILNAAVSGVDAGAVFFAAAALLALINTFASTGSATGTAETLPARDLWLTGVLTGAALSCKYNTAFMLAPAFLAAFIYRFRCGEKFKSLWMTALKVGAGAALCLSPWLIKNVVVTGNPVYPFLYQMIPSRNVHPQKMQQQMEGFKEFGQRTWVQYLRIPWDLSLYYPTGNSYLGTVFLFLLPGFLWLGWIARRAPPAQNILLATAVLTVLLWSKQTQISRYLMPGFPVLAVLCAFILYGAEQWARWFGQLARWCVLGLMVWGLGTLAGMALTNWDPVGVSLGLQNREMYLEQHLMLGYRPMARVINQLPGKVKLYAFGETRTYYIEKPITAVTVYDTNPLLEWLDQGPTAEAVWQKFRQEGYTHLFINAQEAARTRGYETYGWTPGAVARWQELMARYTKRVALSGQQSLYEILITPELQKPVKLGRPLFSYVPAVVSNVSAHFDQAMSLAQQKRGLEAETEFQRMVQLAPEWDVPYTMLAWLYQRQQRPGDAFAMLRRAESLADLNPDQYHELGIMYWNTQQPLEAIRCLKIALAQSPGMETARKNLQTMENALRSMKVR
jgi:tetratricopeptide (TPR) repeat protein